MSATDDELEFFREEYIHIMRIIESFSQLFEHSRDTNPVTDAIVALTRAGIKKSKEQAEKYGIGP